MNSLIRIASLVPSWTETLLASGITPVARTRFCISPEEEVSLIPAVGGTKNLNWSKLAETKPDLLILDREENPKDFATKSPYPYWDSHIQCAHDVPKALSELAQLLGHGSLEELSERWRRQLARSHTWDWQSIPGLTGWVKRPENPPKQLIYLIWQEPWMAVGQNTFIGSMLSLLGSAPYLVHFDKKYPELSREVLDREDTLVLLSTEPFPFHKKFQEVERLRCSSALVDGSLYSWFGVRSLEFLESL